MKWSTHSIGASILLLSSHNAATPHGSVERALALDDRLAGPGARGTSTAANLRNGVPLVAHIVYCVCEGVGSWRWFAWRKGCEDVGAVEDVCSGGEGSGGVCLYLKDTKPRERRCLQAGLQAGLQSAGLATRR